MTGAVPAAVERCGPYVLLERLAPYGMVQPYVGRKDGSIELVMVKRLLPQLTRHPTAPHRFAREARLTRQLRNPHVVRTLDFGFADDEMYMVTEFVAGIRLDVLMADTANDGRPLPLDVVSGIAQRMLNGLGYAHSAVDSAGKPLGLIHRDLNPRSVIVAFSGEVKIGDFGTARSYGDAALTAPGTTVGTLAYMSPEQVAQGELDARSDLYGFSVVLYELLTGGPMLNAQDALSLLRQIKDMAPVPLSRRRPDLPIQLTQVVERGLAKHAAHRWPDANTYAVALQEALHRVAPAASTERLGAYLRARLPDQEKRFLHLMHRVREVSAALPAERFPELEALYDLPAPPPSFGSGPKAGSTEEEPPEPSVMTMPGAFLPVQEEVSEVRQRKVTSQRRLWGIGAAVVAVAALMTVFAWRALVSGSYPRELVQVTASAPVASVNAPSAAATVGSEADGDTPAARGQSTGGTTPTVRRAATERRTSKPGRLRAVVPPDPNRPSASARAPQMKAPSSARAASADLRSSTRPHRDGVSVRDRRAETIQAAARSKNLRGRRSETEARTESAFARSLAELEKRLAALRDADRDARSFDALLTDLRKAAEVPDANVRRAVMRDLSAAERSFDTEGLAQALQRLQRYERSGR